jgi:sugar phosphate isomerase/epimerase
MNLKRRIGVDLSGRIALENGIAWAAANDIHYIDAQIDVAPNALESFGEVRCARIRETCERFDVHLGLHTLSAVNVAEYSPYLRDAADCYLYGYIEAGKRLGAEHIEVHAGYHFGPDRDKRMAAGLERLKRAAEHAHRWEQTLLLENMNWEPDLAEVHYLGHNVEECLYYFDRIEAEHFRWAFTVNHATLVPEGIDGFLDAMPTKRLGLVRLADSNGKYEQHLFPGEGVIDFAHVFRRIEGLGFQGSYMNAFGSLDDRVRGREVMLQLARAGGFDPD